MNESLITAAGLGGVTGLRSMTAIAALSRELAGRRFHFRASEVERWLADDTVALVASGLALGELIADKLPGVPARITPAPLLGRIAIGGAVGAVAAGRDDRVAGAAIGAAAAALGAFTGWIVRTEAGRAALPDTLVALAEDAVALSAAARFAARV